MGVFKEMPPEEVWAAIEGHENVLAKEARELEEFYKQFRCPRCKCELQKEFDARFVFADEDVMNPRALLRCPNCRFLIDPHNNLIVEYGDPSKIPLESIPIINPKT